MTRRVPGLASLVLLVAACAAGPTPPSSPVSPSARATTGPRPSAAPTVSLPPEGGTDLTPSPSPDPTPGPTVLTGLVPGSVDRSSLDLTATYDVDLALAVRTGGLEVGTTITARNDSGADIDRLELNTIAAKLGGLRLTNVTVDDVPVSASIADQTITVPFGGVLRPGYTTTVRIAYTATLKRDLTGSDWMFTRSGGTLALYRWIPWVSRAVPFDRPNHGDPFVLPSSPKVDVEVLTDEPMVLAAPAAEINEVAAGLGRAWMFTVTDVRDVSVLLAPDFEVSEAEANGVSIRAYSRPGGPTGEKLIDQAVHALSTEGDLLGVPYPWPALSVVETKGGYGLESPGLIWIPGNVDTTNLNYLVHHETAHQWFYGLVGNDQQADPFADEAAADLLARTALGTLRSSRCPEDDLDRPITGYTERCYYETIYVQGGRFLDEIRQAMGSEPFWSAMAIYLNTHRHGLASSRDLLDALQSGSAEDLLPLLRARFPSLY